MPKRLGLKIAFLSFALDIFAFTALAGTKEDYDEAAVLYAAANASLAAYGDEVGSDFFNVRKGWETFGPQSGEGQGGGIFLAKKINAAATGKTYIIAFRGTNSYEDVKVDLKLRRVPFAGDSLEGIRSNARKRNAGENLPKVHAGFLKYALTGFDKAGRLFCAAVKNDSEASMIITGHSSGGAAAVLYAAAMAEMGVPPERMKVVTFGAPAVGNQAFAAKYKDRLDALRVCWRLDPVPGGLQAFFPYAQFGRVLLAKSDPRRQVMPHSMERYADFIGKYYYDCRAKAVESKVLEHTLARGGGEAVAVAVFWDDAGYGAEDEYGYMRENLLDAYKSVWPSLITIGAPRSGARWEEHAAAIGAEYLLRARLNISRAKTGKNKWIVTLSQSMDELSTGRTIMAAIFGRQIKNGGSFFQASARNVSKAAAQLDVLRVGCLAANHPSP